MPTTAPLPVLPLLLPVRKGQGGPFTYVTWGGSLPPMNRVTDPSENITFPRTLYVAGKNRYLR